MSNGIMLTSSPKRQPVANLAPPAPPRAKHPNPYSISDGISLRQVRPRTLGYAPTPSGSRPLHPTAGRDVFAAEGVGVPPGRLLTFSGRGRVPRKS